MNEKLIELEQYGESNATLYVEAITPEQVHYLKLILKKIKKAFPSPK